MSIVDRFNKQLARVTEESLVWDFFVTASVKAGFNPLAKSNYSISSPVQVTPEDDSKFRITITNVSDHKFKIGSQSHVDYLKHDASVLEILTIPLKPIRTFTEVLNELVLRSNVQFTIKDFDVDECYYEDGFWYLVASDNSLFFKEGTVAAIDNTGWWKDFNDTFKVTMLPGFYPATAPDIKTVFTNVHLGGFDRISIPGLHEIFTRVNLKGFGRVLQPALDDEFTNVRLDGFTGMLIPKLGDTFTNTQLNGFKPVPQ